MKSSIISSITAMTAAILITACAATGQYEKSAVIGPYTTFSGRLIVIEPTRRWQVLVNWDGIPEKGTVRMTHAASNRIVQISWDHDTILMLDNQSPIHGWRAVNREEIISRGIILPPQQLASILSGTMPETLIQKKPGEWKGRLNGTFLQIRWSDDSHRLELMDITHGRKVILIIQP